MRALLIAAASLMAVAMPSAADTLQEVVKHGIVLTIEGMEIDVTYTPDGKFTAMDGQVTGTWKIDGDKMCTSSNFDPNETCVDYPKGKKSGGHLRADLASGRGDHQDQIAVPDPTVPQRDRPERRRT